MIAEEAKDTKGIGDYVSAIVELETISPIYIQGKEINYGEGFLEKDGNVYLIDNDKLCEYILTKDKVEEYVQYFVRDEKEGFKFNVIEGFAEFRGIGSINLADFAPIPDPKYYRQSDFTIPKNGRDYQINMNRWKDFLKKIDSNYPSEYDEYKEYSLKLFLDRYNIMPASNALRKMAKGVTYLSDKKCKEFIQDPLKRSFIPGSSIKGAIRNALLWKIMSDPDLKKWLNMFVNDKLSKLDRKVLRDVGGRSARKKELREHFSTRFCDESGKTLAQQSFIIEDKKIQGEYSACWKGTQDILRDFFRIVKVSDAYFTKINLETEKAGAVCVINDTTYKKKFDLNLECVKAESIACFKITIDQKMAEETFFGKENLPFCLQSVVGLLSIVNQFYRELWAVEGDFFKNKTPIHTNIQERNKKPVDTQEIEKFYEQREINEDCHLFRTGWGGGLLSKTQFLNLEDPLQVKVRNLIKSNPSPIAPKSRCLIMEDDKAILPLGWCKLKVSEEKDLPKISNKVINAETTMQNPHTFTEKPKEKEPNRYTMQDLSTYSEKSKEKEPNKYKEGDLIKKAVLKGGAVIIKGQDEFAKLIDSPPYYAQVINVVIKKVDENGIVKEVKCHK